MSLNVENLFAINYDAAKSALYDEVRKVGCNEDHSMYGIAYIIAKNSTNPDSDLSSLDSFLATNHIVNDVSDFLRRELNVKLNGKWDIVLRLKAEYPAQQFMAFLLLENEVFFMRDFKGFSTSALSITALAQKILDVKPNERVADFCSGYGTFIVRTFLEEPKAIYTGIELSLDTKAIGEMRSDIIGSSITILSDDVMTYETENKFDKIFSDPPLGVKTFSVENASNKPLQFLNQAIPGLTKRYSSNWLFATAIMNNLADNGKAVVCVTPNAGFGAVDVDVRRYFVENGFIEAVIALPSNLLEVTTIPILLLVLSYGNTEITFVDASEVVTLGRRKNSLSDPDISTIINALDKKTKISKKIGIEDISKSNYDLHPSRYLSKTPDIKNGVEFGSLISSISRGAQIKAEELDNLVISGDTGLHYIMLNDIQDGIVNDSLPTLKELSSQYEKYCVGKDGAFIMSKAGPVFKAAFIQSDDEKILVNGNMYIIKLNEKINPIFLKAFIESEVGQSQLRNLCSGSALPTISADSIKKIIIPLPDLETQNAIAQQYLAKLDEIKVLKDKLRKANEERLTICLESIK